MWHWYYKLLANRPHLVMIFVGVVSIACLIVSITFKKLPEFTDPALVIYKIHRIAFPRGDEFRLILGV